MRAVRVDALGGAGLTTSLALFALALLTSCRAASPAWTLNRLHQEQIWQVCLEESLRLSQKMAGVTPLMAGIAHDFNNPSPASGWRSRAGVANP